MGKFSMFMPAVCVLFFIKLHIKKVVTLFLKVKAFPDKTFVAYIA